MHTLTILPRESYLRHRWNKDGKCERCGFDGASFMLWMQSDEAKAYHDSRFPTCGEEMMESKLKQAARKALESLKLLDEAFCSDDYGTREGRAKGRKALMSARASISELTSILSRPEPEAVQVPQGWRIVPQEPSDKMLEAANSVLRAEYKSLGLGDGTHLDASKAAAGYYRAMLAAAPQPPAQAEPCDMGPICIGCEPRGPRGECPGASHA